MSDVIKRAQELMEKFDGKITEKWGKGFEGDYNGDIVHMADEYPAKYLTETDIKAMSSVPEMLSVIKGLLGECEDVRVRKVKELLELINAGDTPYHDGTVVIAFRGGRCGTVTISGDDFIDERGGITSIGHFDGWMDFPKMESNDA